jgi:hypothetical protein
LHLSLRDADEQANARHAAFILPHIAQFQRRRDVVKRTQQQRDANRPHQRGGYGLANAQQTGEMGRQKMDEAQEEQRRVGGMMTMHPRNNPGSPKPRCSHELRARQGRLL